MCSRHLAFEDVRRVECAFSDLDGWSAHMAACHSLSRYPAPAGLAHALIHRAGGETAKRLVG